MTVPSISGVRLSGARNRAELPLLLLGPPLGASATDTWLPCVEHLADAFDLLGWDLPGQGHNRAVSDEPFTTTELALGVLGVVDDVLAQRDEVGGSFSYAGVGLGAEVGLRLALDAPTRIRDVTLLGLDDLGFADALGGLSLPVLAVTSGPPTALAQWLLAEVPGARLEALAGVAEPAPVTAPERVAALVRHLALGEPLTPAGADDVVRRSLEQLASARAAGVTVDHPGLDARARLVVTLTALVATGRLDELPAALEPAARVGLGPDEVREVLLQAALDAAGGDLIVARRVAGSALGSAGLG